MPQGSGASKGGKKKGRPKHQNEFAFKHNPKSKKTDKILNSPNIHVCRRCHEKIEWRKKYRKYKPLTQPAKCNICQKRNIKVCCLEYVRGEQQLICNPSLFFKISNISVYKRILL